jgi:hypothetical protein
MGNRFARLGNNISEPEVTHISVHEICLLVEDREWFMPFERFPWFRRAIVEAVQDVELPHAGHLYWSQLDIDLAIESIAQPERYPLVSAG